MAKLHKLSREEFKTVLEALVVASIITLVHFFFFRDLMLLAVVAITVSLMGARVSFRQSVSVTLRLCIVFAVASLVSLGVTALFPESFWGYVLAVFVAALLSAVFTKGHYVALTLVMVNIMFFAVLPAAASPLVRFVPLLVLAEALFGAVVTLLVTRLLFGRGRAQKEPAPPPEKPKESTAGLPIPKRIALFFRNLDIRVYKAVAASALSYVVYALLNNAVDVIYPAFIFNATFLAASASGGETIKAGRKMVLGLLVGIGVGFAAFLIFAQVPNYYLAIPFVVVLVVLLNRWLFGRLEPGSVIVAFLLMIDTSGGHPYRFIFDRIVLALIGIAVAVAIDWIFSLFQKRKEGLAKS